MLQEKEHRERISVVISLIALTIALSSAVFSFLQTRVSMRALSINEQLLALNYTPSVDITYGDQRITIFNRGKTNLLLWGDRLDQQRSVVEREPRLITPGGNYYILAQSFEEEIKARFQDGDHWVPFEAYIAAENAKKYVVKAVLLVKMKAGQPQIHCQTTSISETDWRESTHSN